MCHASFSLHVLRRRISIRVGDGYHPLVFVGHGYGGLVLKQALVELHRQSHRYEDLRSNLCGIVFYGGTNTKLTNKHGLLLMENKGRSSKNLTSLKFETVEDRLMENTLSKLSKQFAAALDLKKVKKCVINKNKSILQVCILYPYSNSSL